MKGKQTTYIDDGAPLGRYAKEVVCTCPNCDGPAVIRGNIRHAIPLCIQEARVQCLKCSFSRDWVSDNREWKGPVIGSARQPCPHCGHQWLSAEVWQESNHGKLNSMASAECPACHQNFDLELAWHTDRYTNQPVDPYFGLSLWLQSECCGHTFWAYNHNHLQALKSYVSAKLRDQRLRGKWSMSSRLPQWIKDAKNREELLKTINRLEKKLKETEPQER